MTKVKIPNAVAYMTRSGSRVLTDRETRSMQVEGWDRNKHLEYYSVPLISVADAEALASARVREALEEAAQTCEARIGTGDAGIDTSDCDEEAQECAVAIRALIPMEQQK